MSAIKEMLTEMAVSGVKSIDAAVMAANKTGADIHGPYQWWLVKEWHANGMACHTVSGGEFRHWEHGDPLPGGIVGIERFLFFGEPRSPVGKFATLGIHEVVVAEDYAAKKLSRVITTLGESYGYAECGYCGAGDEESPQPPAGCFTCEYCGCS
jgi:hypothetical protein